MARDLINGRYKVSTPLNFTHSPSTGEVICYDGDIIDGETQKVWSDQFIEITDCRNKIRLHRASYDSYDDWMAKVDILIHSLEQYREHLKRNETTIKKSIEG